MLRALPFTAMTAVREMLVPVSAPAGANQPSARLRIERAGEHSVVRGAFASSPLRLLTPRNHGRAAWVYASTLGGGLVDGDQVGLEVAVGGGAACVLSSQGESRVYRSPNGCSHELRADVEESGLLAVIPDPTVCFAGACYRQRTEIFLAPKAGVAVADVLLAGRTARGERWAFARYAAELVLRIGGRTVIDERILLDPTHGPVRQRFGRFNAFATLLLAGELLRAPMRELREQIDATPAPAGADELISASPLGEDAVLVRMSAVSAEALTHRTRAHLSFLPALLGDDPWARRN